jgi:PAS domain S-box-containing protein
MGVSERGSTGRDERRTKRALIEELQALRRRLGATHCDGTAARADERRHHLLFGGLRDGVYVSAVQADGWPGRFIDVNEAACRQLGYTADELLQRTPMDVSPPEDVERYLPAVVAALQERHEALFETRLVAKDGRAVPFELHTRLVELDGRPCYLTVTRDITDRKRAEDELRASQANLVATIENSSDIIMSADADGRILVCNRAFRETIRQTHGFEPQVGDSIIFENDPQREFWRRRMKETLAGRHSQFEFSYRAGDEVRHFELSASPIVQDGRVVGLTEFTRDITNRKRVEEEVRAARDELEARVRERTAELAASEERWRSLVETAPDHVLLVDPDRTIRFVNRPLLGTTRADLLGSDVAQWLAPESRTALRDACTQALAGDRFVTLEVRGLRPLRHPAWYALRIGGFREAGRIAGLMLIVSDITARRQAEEARRVSEQRFRDITKAAGEFIFEVDRDWRFTFVSEPIEDALGRPVGEILGRSPLDFMPPEDRPSIRGMLDELSATGTPFRDLQHRWVRTDGTIRWQRVSGEPIHAADGQLSGYRGTGLDITAHKQQEERMRRHEAELARVARRSTMGALSGGVAHQLNQPLCALLSSAELALATLEGGGDVRAQVIPLLRDIVDDSRHAAEIVHKLRSFLSKGEVHRQPLDLTAVVRAIREFVLADARQHSSTLDWDLARTLPVIRGDAIQLQQVIINLTHNALEACQDMPVEERRVRIATRSPGADQVIFSVTDRGPGIPADLQARVLEPFFTTKPHGLGMGLAISRSIIEAHGGHIWVRSSPSAGTTVGFALPAAGEICS